MNADDHGKSLMEPMCMQIEFVDFTDPKLLPEDVVKELNKLVFGGTMRKTVSSATKGPDETQIAA